MKTRCITLTLLFAISLAVTAAERSLQSKKQIATAVLRNNTGRNITPHGTLKELKSMTGLTIMGYDEGGFAVISNDESSTAVLAWSDNKFDEANLPDGLRWWLAATDEVLANGPAYATAIDIDASLPAEVQPMLRTTWGQEVPYNLQCPKSYPTGCVATAMAQIMYYHKYPTHGEGSVFDSSNLMFVDFGNTTYAYGDMLDSYAGMYSTTAANAVATLMYHCGVAVNMKYGATASGAYTIDVPTAMRANFLYNKNISYRVRDYHTNADWMKMVYTELAEGRPILYAASDNNGTGGHAFVFDGYDASGYVHVNWGWDSTADGYYDMSILNPSVGTKQYQYSVGQEMVTGAGLPDENIPHRSEFIGVDGISATLAGTTITMNLNNTIYYNLNDYAFSGDLHIMLEGASASYKLYSINFAENGMNIAALQAVGFNANKDVQLPDDLADGTYSLYMGVQDNGFTEINPVSYPEGKTCRYILTKTGTNITLTPSNEHTSGIGKVAYGDDAQGNTVTVYDAQGRMVYKSAAADFNINAVPATGLLIIKNGSKVKKVLK